MVTCVTFRDLPGGPREIKFADEISRHSLCGNCRMLSMSMYRDPNDHAFCEACLNAQSEQHGKDHIYCEYERLNIDIKEMYQDRDLVAMLRDQFVECPNKKTCGLDLHLHGLKDHYITCQPEVKCPTCGRDVRSTEWEAHKNTCAHWGSSRATSEKASPVGKVVRSSAYTSTLNPDAPFSMNTQKVQNGSSSVADIYPRKQLHEAMKDIPGGLHSQEIVAAGKITSMPDQEKRPEPPDTKDITMCPFCDRGVKRMNFNVHVTKCPKSPVTCTHCGQDVEKANKKIHDDTCKSNPQNQAKVAPINSATGQHGSLEQRPQSGRSYAEAVKRDQHSVSKPSKSGRSPHRSTSVVKGNQGERANGSARQTCKEERKRGTREPGTNPAAPSTLASPNYSAHSTSPPASSKHSTSTDVTSTALKSSSSVVEDEIQRPQMSANGDAWLAYMHDGDWCTGFVVMQEWFRANNIREEEKYARLATGLVDMHLDTFVPDFLKDPSQTNPFECLVIAVLGRVWLSRHLCASRNPVTWEDVFDYVPSVFTAQLQKKAKNYLKKFAVCTGPFTDVDEVGEDVIRGNLTVVQLSSSTFDPHEAGCIVKDTQTLEEIGKDMGPDITTRADAYRISDLSGENSAVICPENREVDSNYKDKKSENVMDGEEQLEATCGTPCQLSATTENVPNKQALTAPPLHESVKHEKHVAGRQPFQRANIHHKLSGASKCKPIFFSFDEMEAETDSSNAMQPGGDSQGPERCQKGPSKPFQEGVETNNGANREARYSFLSRLITEKQQLNNDKELLARTALRNINSKQLRSNSILSSLETPGDGMEMQEESTGRADMKAVCSSPCQETETRNKEPNKETCSSSTSCSELNTACTSFSTPSTVAKRFARFVGNQVPDNCGTNTEEKYGRNSGKELEERDVLPDSSAVNHGGRLVGDLAHTSKHVRPEIGRAGSMTANDTGFPTANSHECEEQLSCSRFCTAESSATARIDSSEGRLKCFREMQDSIQAKERNIQDGISEADHHDNIARWRELHSKCGQETSGAALLETTQRVRKGHEDCLTAHSRITEARKEGERNEASSCPLRNEGSLGECTGLLRLQHFIAPMTHTLCSQSACLQSNFQNKHEPQYPSSGVYESRSAGTVEEDFFKCRHFRIHTEQTQPHQNMSEVHLEEASPHQAQESADPSREARSSTHLSKASLDDSAATLESKIHSLEEASTTRAFSDQRERFNFNELENSMVRAGSRRGGSLISETLLVLFASNLSPRVERRTAQKPSSTQSSLGEQQCDRNSRAGGCFESTACPTHRNDAKADTFRLPHPQVETAQTEAGIASVPVPKTSFGEGASANRDDESSQASRRALECSINQSRRFQVDIPSSQASTIGVSHLDLPEREMLTSSAMYNAQSEDVRRTRHMHYPHQRIDLYEKPSDDLYDSSVELFPDEETLV